MCGFSGQRALSSRLVKDVRTLYVLQHRLCIHAAVKHAQNACVSAADSCAHDGLQITSHTYAYLCKQVLACISHANALLQEYIAKTEAFYTKFGGKTIVLARFVPIVRTFAPFVAGVAKMSYAKFAAFNVGGAILWTALFTGMQRPVLLMWHIEEVLSCSSGIKSSSFPNWHEC